MLGDEMNRYVMNTIINYLRFFILLNLFFLPHYVSAMEDINQDMKDYWDFMGRSKTYASNLRKDKDIYAVKDLVDCYVAAYKDLDLGTEAWARTVTLSGLAPAGKIELLEKMEGELNAILAEYLTPREIGVSFKDERAKLNVIKRSGG